MKKLPELLCPAGSPDALDAAIEGGADAVYFGGAAFNARMNAQNFGGAALRSAVLRAHAYGVKTYLTLNTLATDRELPAFLNAAGEAIRAGVDALIVADLGGAAAIRRTYPHAELHASTQMSAHHTYSGKLLEKLGFSRMVIARETSLEDLKTIVKESPIEIEYFIHGALCVSHSGQCLFSSLVGDRSGNRGECAQPCRLPYSCADCPSKKGRETYPLSLKDLSLATHVPELIDCGVSSLKIEGRMKSPEYVLHTARIWRRLLDERRAATPEEMRELADIFSRGGFTDGYFTHRIGHGMLGVRREEDKQTSRQFEAFTGLTKRIPLTVSARIKADKPSQMTLTGNGRSVTVVGDIPQPALTAPLMREVVERNLSKFGGTPYTVGEFTLTLDDGLMLPISRLNDLRRRALEVFDAKLEMTDSALAEALSYTPTRPEKTRVPLRSAVFRRADQITPLAREYFDRIYLPLREHTQEVEGVIVPPVMFDSETAETERLLSLAAKNGAKYALVGNLGHLSSVLHAGLTPVGDFRLNVTNNETVSQLEALGVEECILSPELTLPQMRDIGGNTGAIVYGRIPLMLLEKCVIREISDCKTCATDTVRLRDRKGIQFPVLREWEHRNVIYNSIPTCMSDKQDALLRYRLPSHVFLFSVEAPKQVDAVITAFKQKSALPFPARRINEK